MSRLIGLSDGVFVAADFIAEVKVSLDRQTINVRMKDGQTHAHQSGYGSGLHESANKLVKTINNALTRQDMD